MGEKGILNTIMPDNAAWRWFFESDQY